MKNSTTGKVETDALTVFYFLQLEFFILKTKEEFCYEKQTASAILCKKFYCKIGKKFQGSASDKDQLFWEGHKNIHNLPCCFDLY